MVFCMTYGYYALTSRCAVNWLSNQSIVLFMWIYLVLDICLCSDELCFVGELCTVLKKSTLKLYIIWMNSLSSNIDLDLLLTESTTLLDFNFPRLFISEKTNCHSDALCSDAVLSEPALACLLSLIASCVQSNHTAFTSHMHQWVLVSLVFTFTFYFCPFVNVC